MLTFNLDRQSCKPPESTRRRPAPLSAGETTLLRNILETREVRRILGNVIPEIITVWAGSSRLKRWIAAIINKILRFGFLQPGHGKFNDGDGSMITQMAAAINQIHDQDPEFIARALEPVLQRWIAETDFGELKEMAGKSSQDFKAVIRVLNDNLWQYPAKVILLLALLPDAANMLVVGMKDTLIRFNQISPDVVADISLQLLNEIDGENLGRGINELTELVRKLSVGSALIGEPGFPKMPKDVSRLLSDILSTLDGEKWLKAGMILAEQKQMAAQCLMNQLKARPEFLLKKWARYPNLKNIRLRNVYEQLTSLDESDDALLAELINQGLADIDTETLAEIIHLWAALISRIHDLQPEAIPNLVVKLIDGLDLDLIVTSFDDLLNTLMPDLVSLGRPFLPHMLNGFCDALEPREDAYDTDIDLARKRLGRLLVQQEV